MHFSGAGCWVIQNQSEQPEHCVSRAPFCLSSYDLTPTPVHFCDAVIRFTREIAGWYLATRQIRTRRCLSSPPVTLEGHDAS
jgi:hypothetical protein